MARAPLAGTFVPDVLPGMLLLGLGAGMAFNPMLLAAMSDVDAGESGLASGLVNTSFMMGGALGLAALASLADARTDRLDRIGGEAIAALNGGYRIAFLIAALLTAAAALLGALLLRPPADIGSKREVSVAV
jgi:MFS family permease